MGACPENWRQVAPDRAAGVECAQERRAPPANRNSARLELLREEEASMINFTTGDILKADAEGLVNTVNCVGIMGRGIALQFKNTFPKNFKAYAVACAREEVQPGRMFVFE